jgi:hypothetical protein
LWPTETLLYAVTGRQIPGEWLPLLLGFFALAAAYCIIEWNEKHWHFSLFNLEGRRRTVVFLVIWALSFIIAAYAYPKIEVYANIWNDYLMK